MLLPKNALELMSYADFVVIATPYERLWLQTQHADDMALHIKRPRVEWNDHPKQFSQLIGDPTGFSFSLQVQFNSATIDGEQVVFVDPFTLAAANHTNVDMLTLVRWIYRYSRADMPICSSMQFAEKFIGRNNTADASAS